MIEDDDREQYVAQIIEEATGRIEYQSKPTTARRAEKIEDGMGINLNWEKYTTRVVSLSEVE